MLKKTANSLLILSISIVFLLIAFFYLKYWDIHFSSDTTLIGLMAKSILESGERPIFVWKVGYMGVMLVGYLSAFFFSIFGVEPFVLNLAPTVYLSLLLIVYFILINKIFNFWMACFATVTVILSGPNFYHLYMRTLPNFAESALLGTLCMLSYFKFLELQAQKEYAKGLRYLAASGFFAGFGMYTFPISAYYFLSVCCHALLIIGYQNRAYIKRIRAKRILPYQFIRTKYLKIAAFLMDILCLSLLFIEILRNLVGEQVLLELANEKKWPGDLRGMIAILYYLAFIISRQIYLFFRLSINFEFISQIKRSLFVFTIAFVFGYTPALYYRLLYGGSVKNTRFDLTTERLLNNGDVFFQYHKNLFAAFKGDSLAILLALFFILSIFLYYRKLISELIDAYKLNSISLSLSMRVTIGFFPLVLFCLFMVFPVPDINAGRYISHLAFFYAAIIYLPYLMAEFSKNKHKRQPPISFIISALILLAIASPGVNAILVDFQREGQRSSELDQQISVLNEQNLTRLYGDYWLAYPINFLTKENIIVEPLYANYNPAYLSNVQSVSEVGYFVFKNSQYDISGKKQVQIYTVDYIVTKRLEVQGDKVLFLLKRKKPS